MAGFAEQTNQPLAVYAVVDPDLAVADLVRSNNVLGLELGQADVAVQSVTWSFISGSKLSITARIANQGVISNQTTVVEFKLGSPTGTNLYSATITNLAPGEAADISFLWDISGLAEGLEIYVVVDGAAALKDFDRQNNSVLFAVQQAATTNLRLGPVRRLPGREFQVTITSEAGRHIYLETSGDPETWQPWTNVLTTNTTSTVIDETAASAGQRFYRGVLK